MNTTKEKIIEASKECPEAKRVLQKLFPEAFFPGWILPKDLKVEDCFGRTVFQTSNNADMSLHYLLLFDQEFDYELVTTKTCRYLKITRK